MSTWKEKQPAKIWKHFIHPIDIEGGFNSLISELYLEKPCVLQSFAFFQENPFDIRIITVNRSILTIEKI